jgi:hypothetical protein
MLGRGRSGNAFGMRVGSGHTSGGRDRRTVPNSGKRVPISGIL